MEKAATRILVKRPSRGRPPKLQPGEKALLFLIARMEGKSNRDMEVLLSLLAPFLDKSVSYKYIERLYSDREVKLVLHNLFTLLIEEEGCSGKLAGDGTGYSLSVERHYRSDPEKSGRDYRYAFRFVDLETGMYVAYSYSCKSEMEAFKPGVRGPRRT